MICLNSEHGNHEEAKRAVDEETILVELAPEPNVCCTKAFDHLSLRLKPVVRAIGRWRWIWDEYFLTHRITLMFAVFQGNHRILGRD